MTASQDPAALVSQIRAQAAGLPRLARTVTDVLLADPAAAAAWSINDVAERAGTSVGTVARTARLLGFGGYRSLRLALVAYAAVRTTSERAEEPDLPGDLRMADPMDTVVAKLVRDEQRSLADTAAAVDSEALVAVADLVARAGRVEVFGVMSSAVVAADLTQKLQRLGVTAHDTSDPHLAVALASSLRPGDVAIGVSRSGTTLEVAEMVTAASEAGAATVALTGAVRSRLARAAEHVLLAAGGEPGRLRPAELSGRIGQLLVVDCLFVGVLQRRPGAADALAASMDVLVGKHR